MLSNWFAQTLRLLRGQTLDRHRFFGGVHPPENKDLSLRHPLKRLPLPKTLSLLLKQHIGPPAKPIVQVGERVLKYQKIAEAPLGLGVPIHAPTSGVVSAIKPIAPPSASGIAEEAIIIQVDGLDEEVKITPFDCTAPEDTQCLVQLLQDAGLVGMGGAGFPSARKLMNKSSIYTLIINGAECEPFITCDDLLMQTQPHAIVQGALMAGRALDAQHIVIGVEENKPHAIRALEKAAQGTSVKIQWVPTVYPMGSSNQLIEQITGQEVPDKGHAIDLGVVMFNVATVAGIFDAVTQGKPLVERLVTVSGTAVREAGNFIVPLGMSFADVAEYAKPTTEGLGVDWICGGPMMGWPVVDHQVPISKTTNAILINEPPEQHPELPCIRCAECMDVCPQSLLPQQLLWYSKAEDEKKLEHYKLFSCIECGACDWVCPSHIPLTDYFKHAKADIRQEREKRTKAEKAKMRHEAQLARAEREKAERAERMAAKKAEAQAKAKAMAAEAQANAQIQNTAQSDFATPATAPSRAQKLASMAQADAQALADLQPQEQNP